MNRIDEIVRFRALTEADLAPIIDIQLDHLRERLAARRIELEVTDAARAALAREGYDPAFGARPLKRVIQRRSPTGWPPRCSTVRSPTGRPWSSTPGPTASPSPALRRRLTRPADRRP